MAELSREQFNFSQDFQDLILACILRRPEFIKYAQLVLPKFFSGVLRYRTARCVFDYYAEHMNFPSRETLIELVHTQSKRAGEETDESVEYVDSLFSIHTHDWKFVHEKIVAFCRERAVLEAFKIGVEHFKEGTEPKGGYVGLFQNAMSVGQGLEDIGIVLHRDAASVVDRLANEDYGILTGYPVLDAIWKRGWKPGWLVVPLAPPKSYKSALSVNIALNMAMAGHDVVYYACEISQEETAVRALQNLTGCKESDIYDHPVRFKEKYLDKGLRKLKGHFIFKGYPSKVAKMTDLETHYNNLIRTYRGLNPRALVIDYAETVSAINSDQSEHQAHASVYTDARAFGTRASATIIMPDRMNREACEMPVPTMTAFQGSFQKAGIVDIAFGVCMSPEERAQNIIRLFIFLNRWGQQGIHLKGMVNPELMQVQIVEPIHAYVDENVNPRHHGARVGHRAAAVPPVEAADHDDGPPPGQRYRESRS